jgi:hypothetical protein
MMNVMQKVMKEKKKKKMDGAKTTKTRTRTKKSLVRARAVGDSAQLVRERRCPLARAFAYLEVVVGAFVVDFVDVVVDVVQADLVVGVCIEERKMKKRRKRRKRRKNL